MKQGIVWGCWLALGLVSTPLFTLSNPPLAIAQSPSLQTAKALIADNQVEQAIKILEPLARDNPQSVEVQLTLAIAYQKAGGYIRTEAAYGLYQKVLQLDPNNPEALLNTGVMGGYKYQWRQAGLDALTHLIDLEPNHLAARAQRALLNGYLGNLGDAIIDYELVLPNNPTPETVLAAAEVYTYAGDYERSLTLFNRYKEIGSKPIQEYAALAYATTLRETGDPAASIPILEQELTRHRLLDGVSIRARASLAVSYAANGQSELIQTVLQPLVDRFDSRMIRARALHQANTYESDPAITTQITELYYQVLTQPVDNEYLTVAIAREIADVVSGIPSELPLARQIYQQLLALQPQDRVLQINLAIVERQLGVLPRAELRQRLATALATLPEDVYRKRILAQALVRLDSPHPELLPLYQNFLDDGIKEPLLYFRMAQMQLQNSDLVSAKQSLALYSATTVGSRDQGGRLLLLADIDRREGNLEASAQKYEQIINTPRVDRGILSGAFQALASVRRLQGRLADAVALYDQLIARNPNDASKWLGRTALAYQANLISRQEAEALLNQWLTTRPATDTPLELLSLVAALPAATDREPLYDRLIATNPQYMPLQLRRLQIIALRDKRGALQELARLIQNDPDNLGIYFIQGELGADIGDLDLASAAYERILEQSSQNTDAMAALAGIRFQQRDYRGASALYTQVLEREPSNRIAQSALADLSAAQGHRLQGIEQLERLLQRQTNLANSRDPALRQQIQRLQEGFLQQRGFQPPWERY